ncbi:MAG: flagellar hook-basal body complex protein FliE [Gammaproteobacteria bacterium]|nr:MAG: flagellar hook-basal body complex protein FliE [Gammaproteobacteria bacterium]
MSDMQIQQVLAQMRAMSARAAQGTTETAGATGGTEFASLLRQSLDQVNAAQQTSGELSTRFVAGDPNVSLPEVMVAMQKSSLQFEAVTQVRNRLVAAYQEIMNMQV